VETGFPNTNDAGRGDLGVLDVFAVHHRPVGAAKIFNPNFAITHRDTGVFSGHRRVSPEVQIRSTQWAEPPNQNFGSLKGAHFLPALIAVCDSHFRMATGSFAPPRQNQSFELPRGRRLNGS
jgi:hypothetical protein